MGDSHDNGNGASGRETPARIIPTLTDLQAEIEANRWQLAQLEGRWSEIYAEQQETNRNANKAFTAAHNNGHSIAQLRTEISTRFDQVLAAIAALKKKPRKKKRA